MLSLARVSTRMGQHYYSADNYYTKSREVERSEWFGSGSAEFGLKGKVSADVFQCLLEGRHPITQASLTPDHDNQQFKRRAATDLTFSAPKSVSLAALVGKDERLVQAHEEAVNAALNLCQERYSYVRTGSKSNRAIEATGNLAVAKFHHDTSRAKDPQLHSHCVALNLAKRSDGQWRSLHNDGIFANSKLLGLVYQNELAKRSLALGYQIQVKPNGTFELEGYSEEQLKTFSKRREKIEELGAENQRDARRLVKVQRQAKAHELPRRELEKRWAQEAELCNLKHPDCQIQAAKKENRINHNQLISKGTKHATEHDVSFKKETIETFMLENNLGKTDWNKLQKDISAAERDGLIIKTQHGQLTTKSCVQTEHEMLTAMRMGQETQPSVAHEIPRCIHENTLGLTRGQKCAIELSLTSRDQIIGWQGVAGSGKTFAMKILQEQSQRNGWSICGFAPSAEAAKVLETEGRIPAQTVASLLAKSVSEHKKSQREIWVIDEAGLLSANDCHDLILRAQQERARVILVGDTRQLASVGAGNAFRLLQDNGMKTAQLNESRRQKQETLALAVKDIAAGNMKDGLTKLNENIHEFRREETRVQHATDRYMQLSPDERQQSLLLAGTNRERDLLTNRIRNALKVENQLQGEFLLCTLRRKDLSKEEIAQITKIQPGDVVTLKKSQPRIGLKTGIGYEVMETKNKTLCLRTDEGKEVRFAPNKNSIAAVYEKHECQLAVGDRVRWTKNSKRLGVRNGQDATVVEQNQDSISVRSNDGKTVTLDRSKFAHIDHNYVNTVYSSQGKTCDHVIICADKTFGQEAMYVAVSRAKMGVQIFCEDRESMLSLATVSMAKQSALDIVLKEAVSLQRDREKELAKMSGIKTESLEIETHKPTIGEQPKHTKTIEKQQSQDVAIEHDYSIGM